MYGYKCEYCDGIVQEKIVKREAFKHKDGFVILEDVPVGVCNKCGARYYHASLLHRVAAVAAGRVPLEKTEQVPVAHFA
jgi:YgiT-type zinc finger domain-containing protein